jgi:hypothetical protein
MFLVLSKELNEPTGKPGNAVAMACELLMVPKSALPCAPITQLPPI